ncbi:hypothetical protein [Streptococcus dysgalactiae]|uniref:hypothetical protein n=1 Tax=Streptococcus dysgalactiae TaxID=1334 RepID=UPI003FD74E16
MTKQQIEKLADLLSPFAAKLYLDMIPEFQEGYASYVYQTQKEDTQKRRIKQLTKSFARLLDTPSFYVMPLSAQVGRQLLRDEEIACHSLSSVGAIQAFEAAVEDEKEVLQLLRNGSRLALLVLEEANETVHMDLGILTKVEQKVISPAMLTAIEEHLLAATERNALQLTITVEQGAARTFYQAHGFHQKADDLVFKPTDDKLICQMVKDLFKA